MPRRSLIHALAPALVGAALLSITTFAQPSPGDELHRLFEDRFAWQMEEYPEWAMSRGDYTNASRVTDQSLEAIARRHERTRTDLERLRVIDRSLLDDQDQVNYDLFELELEHSIAGHEFRTFLAPIGGRYGPHQSIPQMAERVRFKTEEDYANYLSRLEQVPQTIDALIERLEAGLREGRTPPKITLEGVPGQFDALLDEGGLDRLRDPFARMPETIPPARREALLTRFDEVSLPSVLESMRRLGRFVTEEYIPATRESIAATDWPDGEAYYNHQLRVMTTTDLTAREIHEIGLREVARIRAEMLEVIRSSDFMERRPDASELSDNALFDAFIEYLRTDPRFYCETEDELLMRYRDICKRADAKLPRVFKTLPRLPYGVREVPEFMAPNQTTAYYMSGDIRNAEPGYFYANTYALDQRPTYEMIALALHEAVPGHHLQIALAQELEGLPEFRKEAGFTAFVEGWALYSERLGIEMEMYEDPYDDFGRLLYEMWRACRLVVDPGMHALGWSRQEAIDFMLANTALSELNITTEVDRYIAWPGQATGYKIGELKIRELRERAEQALGAEFDLREFHDVVLLAGAIPLNVLETRVNEWIERSASGVDGPLH
ncbi:MAG: DUF885 domain-containing protein [Phycisphaerales bacterium]